MDAAVSERQINEPIAGVNLQEQVTERHRRISRGEAWMRRGTSISSRITWSVFAGMVLVATCFVALKVLPTCKGVYTQMQMPLPGFTRLVFAAGPAVLIAMGTISASFMVIGEFKPVARRIREPLGFLVMVLAISALAAMYMPRFKCGEVINAQAAAPVRSTDPQAAVSAQDFTKPTR